MWIALLIPLAGFAIGEERPTESQKIERLVEHVATLKGAVFIRNGKEYDARAAAEHLRKKWNYVKDEIKTARDFIDKIATKSSLSGQPYRIRLADGREFKSGEYLHAQLKEIEKADPPPDQPIAP